MTFWLRPCELYNNSSLVRYKLHKKYVTNIIGVHLVHYMVYNMLIISQIMKVFTETASLTLFDQNEMVSAGS